MGVAGLWDILRPASKVRSLTEVAVVEGFESNANGMRGFRVGIDASIWFFHANYGKEGENPELRTLFFRCATLLRSPFLPLFVFDGPKRPGFKRGKRINTSSHKLTTGMKAIIEAFGFEWRTAPGEAEAELAYLNRVGVIDAILSDDVDTFLFGATMVIRNSSNTLSGNKSNPILNSDGRDDKNHSAVYLLSDIKSHPSIGIDRGGFILIGLMRGGDYHQAGVSRCGPIIAHGLARAGFGESLYQAAQNLSQQDLIHFLDDWRNELRHELRTNSQGYLGKKFVALSKSITNDFPNLEVLDSYVNPITSESMGRTIEMNRPRWEKDPDLGKLAETCEFYFEWGYKEAIVKRFRTVIWPSVTLRILRRAVLVAEEEKARSSRFTTNVPSTPRKQRPDTSVSSPIGTPSKMITKHFSSLKLADEDDNASNLVVKIHSQRRHPSTDKILEYRLEVAPAHLVRLTEAGVKGIRRPDDADEWASEDPGDEDDEDDEEGGKKKGPKKPPPPPDSHIRVWMPASIVALAEPEVVEAYEETKRKKAEKKANKGRKTTSTSKAASGTKTKATTKAKPAPAASRRKKAPVADEEEEEDDIRLQLANLREEEEESSDDALPIHAPPLKRTIAPATASMTTSSAQLDLGLKSFFTTQKLGTSSQDKVKEAPMRNSSTSQRSPNSLPTKVVDLTSRTRHATTSNHRRSATTSSSQYRLQPTMMSAKSLFLSDSEDEPGNSNQPPPKFDIAPSKAKVPPRTLKSPYISAPSPMPTPTSFPLDQIAGFSIPNKALSSSYTHPAASSSRRKIVTISDSDESDPRPNVRKSPRKSVKHASPHSGSRTQKRALDARERPSSPSPMRSSQVSGTSSAASESWRTAIPSLPKSHHRAIEILEISSDDEPPVDLEKVPPLLAARARAQKANLKAQNRAAKEKGATKSVSSDIIDLT
ncbi:hypothetical protein BDN71DRAFT_858492 [Pleurotus eryngii]|uniref:XPG-I domain-containing protein n=1 Tax=Pleurotus eryngii TaxID=5323 RepID=A0A9P6DG83_PLEER|nr:hypothetical protein BDN71DRAFT_858492 [Pleurotus eryngii]